MGSLLSLGASAPSVSWAALPSDAHAVRDTHLGATSPAWECSPGPTRECVTMTIHQGTLLPRPLLPLQKPCEKSEFTGLFKLPGLLHRNWVWEIFPLRALGRWGKGEDSSLKTNRKFPSLLGCIKKSTFLQQGLSTIMVVMMFLERKMTGDI